MLLICAVIVKSLVIVTPKYVVELCGINAVFSKYIVGKWNILFVMFINVFFLFVFRYKKVVVIKMYNSTIQLFIKKLFAREILIISSVYTWYILYGKYRHILYIGLI